MEEEAIHFCRHTITDHWGFISRIYERAALQDKQSVVVKFVPLLNETESWHSEPESFVVFLCDGAMRLQLSSQKKKKEKTTKNWIHFSMPKIVHAHTESEKILQIDRVL